jgi:hypothetical protein
MGSRPESGQRYFNVCSGTKHSAGSLIWTTPHRFAQSLHSCALAMVVVVVVVMGGCSSQAPLPAAGPPATGDTSVSQDLATPEEGDAPSLCESDQACALLMGEISPCLRARCDLFSGLCVTHKQPSGLACDDGDTCTTNDICDQGICQGGVPVTCDDENACTQDVCLPESGCSSTPLEGGCNDGDPCTVGESCQSGLCVATEVTDCDDENTCTTDECISGIGCVHEPEPGEPCDDQNACSSKSECTGSGACGGLSFIDCDDQDPCTADTCEPEYGCVFTPNNGPCNDGSVCTDNDVCSLGTCAGTPLTCNDQDACTVDECVETVGCTYTGFEGPCDDENACTTDDICDEQGECEGAQLSCDDGNPCTFTKCDTAEGCSTTNLPGSGCEDGDLCTVFDECSEDGVCVPGPAPSCDDTNTCTTDSCEPSVGCVFTPFAGPCDDGNPCTENESCQQGYCAGNQTNCDDDNSCTNDSCSSVLGCQYSFYEGSCDDDSLCTHSESCEEGVCVGIQVDCADGNSCTQDTCDPEQGCDNPVLPDLSPCDDGDLCTLNDTCVDGSCQLSGQTLECVDGDDCTVDQCEPLEGCLFPTEAACLPPTAWPVINEVDYEQFGSDTSDFIELLIVGEGMASLELYTVELIDGDTGNLYDLISLSQIAQSAAPGDRIVIGPPSIANGGDGASLGVVVPGDFLQNGSGIGDAIRVVRNDDEIMDTVSYETAVDDASEGDQHIGFDSDLNNEPLSLGRCADGLDTDDNGEDFSGMPPSPGLQNLCPDGSAPTYWDDIQPIFATWCGACHAGVEPSTCSGSACFASHYEVNQWMSAVCVDPQLPIGACNHVRILDGSMPKNLSEMMPPSEVELIETWINSGMLKGMKPGGTEI